MSHLKIFFCSILVILFTSFTPLYASAIDPDHTIRPFPKMPPIHRGFVKTFHEIEDDDSGASSSMDDEEASSSDEREVAIAAYETRYTFHVLGQGKLPKETLLSACMTFEMPTACSGYARLKRHDADDSAENWIVQYFDMPPADKHVGRTAFADLLPNTAYDLQIGYRQTTDAVDEDSLDWSLSKTYPVLTPPEKSQNVCSFVYGSCNRIGLLPGGIKLWRDKGSDIFQVTADDIAYHASKGLKTDAFISLGDWVYMDATGDWTAAKTFDEMMKRYDLVHKTAGTRTLFDSFVPVYQMWNDHERWNNSTAEIPPSRLARAAAGKRAYDLFQRPQGPHTPENWYVINDNLEGFVMDLRSELLPSTHKAISDEQMAALKAWLSAPERADRVKPVFMSTTALMLQGDPWEASPEQLSEILNYIKDENLKYVAFFSGDIHCGKSALWRYVEGGSTESLMDSSEYDVVGGDVSSLIDSDSEWENDESVESYPLYIAEIVSSAFHKINANKAGLLSPTLDLSSVGGPQLSAVGKFSPTTLEDHFTRVIINHAHKSIEVIKKDRHNTVLIRTLFNLETGFVTPLDISNDSESSASSDE